MDALNNELRETSIDKGLIQCILGFLEEIGISVTLGEVPKTTFLPGVLVDGPSLVVDLESLKFPGDLLHEAGHLAIMEPGRRQQCHGDISVDAGDELGAIAWSWAALKHLNLEPSVVFHSAGYKEDAEWLIELFSSGGELGVPLLQWMGLTQSSRAAEESGSKPFPKMLRWLRE